MSFIAAWVAGFMGSLFAILLVGRVATERSLLIDVPNVRSSHGKPTPRGGGLGLVVVGALSLSLFTPIPTHVALLMISSISIAALTGLLDDLRDLSVRSRLIAYGVAGILMALTVAQMESLADQTLGVQLAIGGWWVFWTLSVINVVNFMDGIDTLIGLQLLIFSVYLLVQMGPGETAIFPLAVMGGVSAFLIFNWPPASIFLGDSGSAGGGALLVSMGIVMIHEAEISFGHAFMPLMPLFADEVMTMWRRVKDGESPLRPHRRHVYQILTHAQGWSHPRAGSLYAGISLLCAGWALIVPRPSVVFYLGAMTLLVLIGLLFAHFRRNASTDVAVGIEGR